MIFQLLSPHEVPVFFSTNDTQYSVFSAVDFTLTADKILVKT